ncbi:hypothetical protein V6N11_068274 [Hibiscus sabdariffa]
MSSAVSVLQLLIRTQSFLPEIGPQLLSKEELSVSQLPQQEVADPEFSSPPALINKSGYGYWVQFVSSSCSIKLSSDRLLLSGLCLDGVVFAAVVLVRQSEDRETENLNPPPSPSATLHWLKSAIPAGEPTARSRPLSPQRASALTLCSAPPAAPHLSPPQKPSHPIRLVSGSGL